MGGEEGQHLLQRLIFGFDIDQQVGAIKTGDKGVFVAKVQRRFNIFLHPWRGRGGEGDTNGVGQPLAHRHELAIFRAEIMSPLRDAMAFVNHQRLNAHLVEQEQRFRA